MQRLDAPTTLIIGANGRLGTAFRRTWPQASPVTREVLDITDEAATRAYIMRARPTVILNCAALTDQRTCERNPDRARSINVDGVRHLRAAADAVEATLVHFSCDRAANPVNVYGRTKLESEPLGHLTIRARIYDGSHPVWSALSRQESLGLSIKHWMNPISTTSLVTITFGLLNRSARGLIEVGTRYRLSEYEVGRVWASVLGTNPELITPVQRAKTDSLPTADSVMSTLGVSRHNIYIPTLEEDAALHRSWYIMNRD
ncbi:MAG: sugar nucleotide-binding protein [Pleurocapsa minor GSE-CHR-MK-17-07R]|jgi:dTDP-4-dehydrorhamnose reductase|nr:sugar nucleotide-binding protein [Pleurocapsa minor GSE-CHR-MK 17-07R]